jgi:hypothetical protein
MAMQRAKLGFRCASDLFGGDHEAIAARWRRRWHHLDKTHLPVALPVSAGPVDYVATLYAHLLR